MEFGATIPKTGIPFDRFNVVSRRYYLKRKDELMNRGILRNNMIVTFTLILTGFFFCACGTIVSLEGGIPQVPGDGGKNSLTLGWIPPTTNQDGTPLEDLAGYRVYYENSSGDYFVENVSNYYTTITLVGLSTDTWYMKVTAFDYYGNESVPSNEVSYTFF